MEARIKDTLIKRILYFILIIEIVFFGYLLKTLLDELGTVRYIREVQIVETTETKIRKAFPEHPHLMLQVAKCESGVRQFDTDGNVIISPTKDFGLFQINEATWHEIAEELGLDYKNSEEDNIAMAQYVLKEQGIEAWVCYTDHIALR